MALGLFAALLWRREGWRVRDILHGVKGFTVAAYRRMQVSESGVTIDLEMVVRTYRLRVHRIEFPVHEVGRPHGETKFTVWSPGSVLALGTLSGTLVLYVECRQPFHSSSYSSLSVNLQGPFNSALHDGSDSGFRDL
jgi:hypothetical protein